ncbi:hypothetical protein V757_01125 [Pelistega indica]|uniref:Cyanophage baseplate Pam3 plug gp18 domain-containing protein n=1 Tax=Pelistega indica TaxID=1414851 RepID=V8GB63_9BURK|nr:hypothetical protein [Pelistega indica]ETD72972.1 hypothetical protein V757_01125 [Pelistega indica]
MYLVPILVGVSYQEQVLDFEGMKIRITLKYNSVCRFWTMDVFEIRSKQMLAQGLSLVCGIPLLNRTLQSFEMFVSDESGENLDPIELSDLGSRNLLFIDLKERL